MQIRFRRANNQVGGATPRPSLGSLIPHETQSSVSATGNGRLPDRLPVGEKPRTAQADASEETIKGKPASKICAGDRGLLFVRVSGRIRLPRDSGSRLPRAPRVHPFQSAFRQDDTAAPIPNTTLPPSNDYTDRLILFRSHDGGATWDRAPDIGSTYGEVYPSLLHLADGRVLFTFTVRSLQPQLGVQAVLGTETSDGFTLNFAQDQIVVDNQTPAGQPSGGGFGNTLQLADGTLVTAYSYRDAQGATNAEVVRWRL